MNTERSWYEDDSFWETWGPVIFSEQRIQNAVEETDKIVSLLQITPGTRVLDLCCGVGRHSLELARRGFKVTGVDRTAGYLKQAREQAEKEGLDIEFVRSDMRDFRRPDAFDAVFNLFTSFGYFEDSEDDCRVIRNISESLKPDGIFIIDMQGKESLARIFQKRMWHERDGVIILQEHTVDRNWSWMQNRWILLKDNERIDRMISHRLYAGTEMVKLLSDNGFSRVDVYGNFDGNPYDDTAQRLVVVGYK